MNVKMKCWKLEVTSAELALLQIALNKFSDQYEGTVFSKEEFESTRQELNRYEYITLFNRENEAI